MSSRTVSGGPAPDVAGADRTGRWPDVADDALAEVPAGRQGGRAAAPVRRPDGGDRAGVRLLGHALELLREVDPAAAASTSRRRRTSSTSARCTRASSRSEPGNCPICGMPLSKRKKGEKTALPEGVAVPRAARPVPRRPGGHPDGRGRLRPAGRDPDDRRLGDVRRAAAGPDLVEDQGHVAGREARTSTSPARTVEGGRAAGRALQPRALPGDPGTAPGPAIGRASRRGCQTALGRSLLGDRERPGPAWPTRSSGSGGSRQEQIDEILAHGARPTTGCRSSRRSAAWWSRRTSSRASTSPRASRCSRSPTSRHVWVQAQVYEDQIGLVRVGQAVEATVEAYPGEVFKGNGRVHRPGLDPRPAP